MNMFQPALFGACQRYWKLLSCPAQLTTTQQEYHETSLKINYFETGANTEVISNSKYMAKISKTTRRSLMLLSNVSYEKPFW